jgi:effector-binding domain-containing protein
MIDTPQIVQTDEQPAAVIHLVVSCAEIALAMNSAIAEVLSALAAQGIAPAGPCFSFHRRRPTDTFDFEVGFPVDRPLNSGGRVKMGKLPAARVARTVYRGGYEGLGAAWGEFCAWLDAEGLSPQDGLWERYLSGPESNPDPATWQTELNRPLAP